MNFSVLSWNVRGFERKEKIKAARDLLARVKPSVGFFQETKLDQVNGNFGRKLWGNLHRCVVSSPAIGSAGGLISTWDPEFFSISDRIINQRFIVLVETLTNGNHSFGFVNVYGPSIDSAKTEFFEELYKVIAKFNVAWVVGGDFNTFLNPEEKLGLSLNSFSMNVFKEFVGNMQGIDLPLCGGAFTWCNNRDPPTFVRLDRFIVTADVLLKFPNICQVLLPRAISDHNAILLHYTPVNWGLKPFKIFNYWVHKAGFDDLMASVFSNHNSNGSHKGIGALLRDSKKAIKAWRESQCQDRNVSIDKLVASINEMEGKIQSGVLPLSAMIEVASLRRKKNQISCLTVGSRVVYDLKIVKEAVKSHFSLEFNHVSTLEVESLNLPFTKLRPEQAGLLESIFTEEETLSTKFPRIFALAINKTGVIAEFGVRRFNHWVWDIHLRRCLFDWEVPSWNELLYLLESFQSSGLGRDWVQWIGSSDGLYSIKALKLQLNLASSSEVELLKRGVSGVADDLCPFCNQVKETVEHLFFTCSVAWQL
ncbi:hypothetical protein V6N11_011602 [Hibiscus sabdariffa]|uniref:Endonuclease/exonuclease/phosphatase domain-containing protein n=1 Tax=Hibiscus sabdariffa TaxID=183260 RepID=A0ABR2S9I1_9ROSI